MASRLMKIVGTAKNIVARSRAIEASTPSGTKRRWSTTVAQLVNAAFMIAFWPNTWKSGRKSSRRSVWRTPMWWAEA